MNASELSGMVMDSNEEVRMLSDCVSRAELFEIHSAENALQHGVVLPDTVVAVSCEIDTRAKLSVCEVYTDVSLPLRL